MERRVSAAQKKIFESTYRSLYSNGLTNSGYTKDIQYVEQQVQKQRRRIRSRHCDEIWFNPPYSQAVLTEISKRFLALIDKHFPPRSKWHHLFNRITVKISYCCTRNMAAHISGHNKKVMEETGEETKDLKPCPKQKADLCQLNRRYSGKCRMRSVVYQLLPKEGNKTWNCILA